MELPPRQDPEIVWRREVDFLPLGGNPAYSRPALIRLHDGTAAVALGCEDGFVRILSLDDGRELRRIALSDGVESGTLQLSDGTVVVGDITGTLYGVDPDGGRIRWRYSLSTLLLGSPVPIDDGFLVQTMDNRIYRFSRTGTKVWSFDGYPGGVSIYAAPDPLVVYAPTRRVLAVLTTGDLIALKGENGDLLWRKQLLLNADAAVLSEMKAPIADMLALDRLHYGLDRVAPALLVPLYQGSLRILNRDTGEQVASRDLSLRAAPRLAGGRLFLADSGGVLRAVDIQSGAVLWKRKLGVGEPTSVTPWKGWIWVADDRGLLRRFDMDGHPRGLLSFPGSIDRAPVVTPRGLIVRTSRGGLYLIH